MVNFYHHTQTMKKTLTLTYYTDIDKTQKNEKNIEQKREPKKLNIKVSVIQPPGLFCSIQFIHRHQTILIVVNYSSYHFLFNL